jgi:CBS domain-containing protein/AmiR/NasT family two-component response regulator
MNPIRLLVVDEHPAVSLALTTRLASTPGIEVVGAAPTFSEGLRAARTLQPDVVLLELKGSGRQPERVREMAHALNGKGGGIIVLTSYADEDEREMALQTGARRYLLKNINSARLITEIKAVAAEAETAAAEKEIVQMKQELVSDWMTRDVITVSSDTILPEVHRLMTQKRIRRVPVVDDGKLAGIVTYGDVRGAEPSGATSLSVWEVNYLLAQLQVEEIMTPDPLTVHPEATIGEAAQIMLQHKISGLPVVTWSGELVGIITESDIFRMVVHDWISLTGLEKVVHG